MLNFDSLLNVRQWIQWKTILFLVASLTVLHFLFQDEFHQAVETGGADVIAHFAGIDPTGEDWGFGSPLEPPPDAVPHTQTPPVEIQIQESKTEEVQNIESAGSEESTSPTANGGAVFDEHVAICISVMNQSEDLTEWLVHHYHHMGIKRFYIMDDGSEPPLSAFQYPGVPRSALTFTYQDRATRSQHMQTMFYSWCLERWNKKHAWMAFIDSDEFLGTPGNETLLEVLKSFEEDESIGALGVNWKIHTSSGLLTRPESTRKSFTTCMWDGEGTANQHIKSIVKTSHAGSALNPHKFNLRPGTNTVGENGDIIHSHAFREPITRDRVAMHHYAVKSRQEFEEKLHRGNGMSDPKNENMWREFEFVVPHVNCTEMAVYNP